jgi:hypothetical protein
VLQWTRPQERPLLIGRSTNWSWASQADGPQRVHLTLGLDVYNASDVEHGQNQLRWAFLPPGWEVRPQPTAVPKLETYRVFRTGLTAGFDVTRTVPPAARQPAELDLTIDSPTAKLVHAAEARAAGRQQRPAGGAVRVRRAAGRLGRRPTRSTTARSCGC